LAGFLSARVSPASTSTLQVAATIFPVADLIAHVGGDLVAVHSILEPGSSPHTFDLTPQKAIQLTHVTAIFGVGQGLDLWTEGVSRLSGAPIISLDKNVPLLCGQAPPVIQSQDEHEEDLTFCDPHYWLSVPNAMLMVDQLVTELSLLDPVHADTYRSNANTYLTELTQLNEDIHTIADSITDRDIVTFHESFTYFAKEYGLTIRATVEPSPGREPSPQQLVDLQKTINVYNVRTLYKEPQLSDSVLQAFTKDLNISIQTLDPLGGIPGRDSYSQLMLFNAHTFAQTP